MDETKGKENIQPKKAAAGDAFNIEDFLKQDIHNDFSQVFVSFQRIQFFK